ncbi:MAG: glycerate kinase [Actinomycetota bacterium]|nr:glycerate kinase [Actinomycetota bacterium]
MTRVLLAPDKFKGTLTAAQVSTHVANGLRSVLPDLEVVVVPVADGGDGTLAAAVGGGFSRVALTATGPTGEPVETAYAIRGLEAVVELAEVSGLAQLPGLRPAPLTATSRGTGELIAAALDAGARRVVVGIGGSACTDGGAGLLEALGARILTATGDPVAPGGAGLAHAARLELSALHRGLADADIVVACDVDNALTGPTGAAVVYGPQKGASVEDVAVLDSALAHFADLVADATGAERRDDPGAGAAGGVGFGLVSVAGATMRPGAELVFELIGLADAMADIDLVITGEGSLDEQTLSGKAPAAVADLARRRGIRTVAVAGRVLLTREQLRSAGIVSSYSLLDVTSSAQEAMRNPGPPLQEIGARIAVDLLGGGATTGAVRPAADDDADPARVPPTQEDGPA